MVTHHQQHGALLLQIAHLFQLANEHVRESNNKLHTFLDLAITDVLEETANLERMEKETGTGREGKRNEGGREREGGLTGLCEEGLYSG